MKILFVENHDIFAVTVTNEFLSRHAVTIVPTVAGALAALANNSFDLLLVDYDLEDAKGDEIVRAAAKSHPSLKIIGASAHERGNVALTEAGAHAVCRKMQFDRIPAIIERLMPSESSALAPREDSVAPSASLVAKPELEKSISTAAPKMPKEIVLAWVKGFNRPDVEPVCAIENLFQDGDWIILEWCNPGGQRGCVLFQIVDGKIVQERPYGDRLNSGSSLR